VIQVPLVSVRDEQQTVGFGVFGHEFIERQIRRDRALRGTLGASGVATDDGEVSAGLLRV